jgi:hypothetical protein
LARDTWANRTKSAWLVVYNVTARLALEIAT